MIILPDKQVIFSEIDTLISFSELFVLNSKIKKKVPPKPLIRATVRWTDILNR